MFASDNNALTYAVVTDELIAAAESVSAVTDSAEAATIENLPLVVSTVGHGGLEVAFRDYCARWDTGLSHLVGDSHTMASRLVECATAYVDNEDSSEGGYQALLTYSPTPPWGTTPNVGPIG